jgi:SAM-dependent methyltransferase
MQPWLFDILCCPECGASLRQVDAALTCLRCIKSYPVTGSISRFVEMENYANNFGFQWTLFAKTQLDSNSGRPISRERFFHTTGWKPEEMAGKLVLDIGCGSGRFAEIALSCGARVVAVDYSRAVEACYANLGAHSSLAVVQADLYHLPFQPGTFDYAYCMGVLQHTPDVERAFLAIPQQVTRGGRVAVDVYAATALNLLWPKYWLLPVTKKLRPERLFSMVRLVVPPLLAISRVIRCVPWLGRRLSYLIPVANYEGVYPLNEQQLKEWAVLDTFDMLSPAHDQPQSVSTMRNWAQKAGLHEAETFRAGFVICRGTKR